MHRELSPQTEQYLDSVVAAGQFASKEAALEAAVEALRAKSELPLVPGEHMARVEQGLESALAGRVRELTEADWQRLRQHAIDAAAGGSAILD